MPRGRYALLAAMSLICASRGHASVAIVPDDFATLGEAIASPAETIWVRPGDYPERVEIVLESEPLARASILIEAYPGTGVADRPRLAAIALRGKSHTEVVIRGVHLVGAARLTGQEKSKVNVTVESCAFDSGLTLLGSRPAVRGSVIRGDVLFSYSEGGFTADTLFGGRILAQGQGTMGVERCVFEGPGAVAIELDPTDMNFGISGCVILRYDRGIDGNAEDQPVWIADNRFEDCGVAIDIREADVCYVLRNEVWRGGTGIRLSPSTHFTLMENRILACTGSGIVAYLRDGAQADVFRNIVGSCGGDGIALQQEESTTGVFVSNTCYGNGGSGISLQRAPGDVTLVTGNIGFDNGAYGLQVDRADHVLSLGCNDWFGNSLGAVNGTSPGATDLALDPLFCDVAAGDVHLRSTSPLLAVPGCDAIGALGVGCEDGTTATLVLAFAAERVAEGVRVVWRVAAPLPSEAWVERSDEDAGPWTRIVTERSASGEDVLDLDRGASEDRAYFYRLVAVEGGRAVVLAGPISIAAASGASFTLLPVTPNPSRGLARLEYSMPRAAAIALDVFDLQGRAVASLARGPHAAGLHRVDWAGTTHGGSRAAPGVYLVRLRYPGGEVLQRLVRLE